jgi:hypothetical protein
MCWRGMRMASGRDARVLRLDAHAPRTPLAQRACTPTSAAGGQVECFDGDLAVPTCWSTRCSASACRAHRMRERRLDRGDQPRIRRRCSRWMCRAASMRDSGDAPRAWRACARTLQFIARHRGLRTGIALDHAGDLALAALDLPETVFEGIEPAALADGRTRCRGCSPRRATPQGRPGHVLCIGGDHGSGGAIAAGAEAALRSGAGLVSVATRAAHVPACWRAPGSDGARGRRRCARLAPLLARAGVIALGPGLGQGEWGARCCGRWPAKPLVVDADALNLLAHRPRTACVRSDPDTASGRGRAPARHHRSEVQRDRFAAARHRCRLRLAAWWC